jgi:hypothetical protein
LFLLFLRVELLGKMCEHVGRLFEAPFLSGRELPDSGGQALQPAVTPRIDLATDVW